MSETPQIVAIGGLPGCGKTSAVQPYLDRGFTRVNRDATGGSLRNAAVPFYQEVRRLYGQGVRTFVFDNTFCFPVHRKVLAEVAKDLGLPVHLIMLDVDVPQAQLFAARRQVQRYGKLFNKDEFNASADPNMFSPLVQFRFAKELKEVTPSTDEGFETVEFRKVKTVWGPEYVNRAILLDLDGTVRVTPDEKECPWPRNKDEVIILEGRKDLLKRKQREGFKLLAVTNQSGINRKPSDPKYVSEEAVVECIEATAKGLGLIFDDYLYAPDRGGPPQTFWRKPVPGMAVYFIEKYKLQPSASIVVGDATSDKTFAERCGIPFQWAHEFFR